MGNDEKLDVGDKVSFLSQLLDHSVFEHAQVVSVGKTQVCLAAKGKVFFMERNKLIRLTE